MRAQRFHLQHHFRLRYANRTPHNQNEVFQLPTGKQRMGAITAGPTLPPAASTRAFLAEIQAAIRAESLRMPEGDLYLQADMLECATRRLPKLEAPDTPQ